MTLPRRGTRRISIDGETFLWRIRKHPTYGQAAFEAPMHLAVQLAGAAGVLVVDLVISRPDNWIHPHQTSVTPAIVRDAVTAARAAGWDPGSPGAFELRFPLVCDRA